MLNNIQLLFMVIIVYLPVCDKHSVLFCENKTHCVIITEMDREFIIQNVFTVVIYSVVLVNLGFPCCQSFQI